VRWQLATKHQKGEVGERRASEGSSRTAYLRRSTRIKNVLALMEAIIFILASRLLLEIYCSISDLFLFYKTMVIAVRCVD
jgi:hypothetical protein